MTRSKRRGHSALEFAFFLPYLLFLFVGAFDWGFYSWALLSTENAVSSGGLIYIHQFIHGGRFHYGLRDRHGRDG